jgi:hypothetical protein
MSIKSSNIDFAGIQTFSFLFLLSVHPPLQEGNKRHDLQWLSNRADAAAVHGVELGKWRNLLTDKNYFCLF